MNFSIKPISDYVKSLKKRYNDAYNRGQNKESVRRAKARISVGAGE